MSMSKKAEKWRSAMRGRGVEEDGGREAGVELDGDRRTDGGAGADVRSRVAACRLLLQDLNGVAVVAVAVPLLAVAVVGTGRGRFAPATWLRLLPLFLPQFTPRNPCQITHIARIAVLLPPFFVHQLLHLLLQHHGAFEVSSRRGRGRRCH